MNDHTTTEYVSTDDITGHLAQLTHLLAGRTVMNEEAAWKRDLLVSMLDHPDQEVRCDLAAYGSLALLRQAVVHPDPAVRYAAVFNRYVIDTDVQNTLAGDIRHEVVEVLVDRVDLGREAIQIIIDGTHVGARLRLAHRRISIDLLNALASDEDLQVRTAALDGLGVPSRRAA
jgi:hypothetical protein